jgi:ribosomal protein S12 methylthiotransferase accessory factor
MKIRAVADGGSGPASLGAEEFLAYREMLACVSTEAGPVLRASSFLGSGEPGGGGYAGHAEIYDLDGLLRDTYQQPSMEPGVNDTLFGGGKGFSLAPTMLSTVGEAVERAVAGLVGCSPHLPGPRVMGSWNDLTGRGHPALHPDGVGLFSETQYASPHFLYARLTPDTVIQWVEAHRLVSGDPVWVPAQLVDMVHIYDPAEEIVGYPVSGGLSCHTSTAAATYHGLTEVIERDAVNVSWYGTEPPRRVRIDDTVRGVLGGFADRLRLDHSASYLLMHPSGVCTAPTLSVVGFQEWLSRRQYCAGGGCDVDPYAALRKAAAEFGQTRSTLGTSISAPRSAVGRSVRTMFDWEVGRPLAEMTLFFQAIGYYGLDEYADLLDHYLSGPEVDFAEVVAAAPAAGGTVEQRLAALLEQLGGHGIDPIVLNYSHPQWRQLAVVKVYIPELTTPFLQSRPMLGHPRLATLRESVRAADGTILPLPYP